MFEETVTQKPAERVIPVHRLGKPDNGNGKNVRGIKGTISKNIAIVLFAALVCCLFGLVGYQYRLNIAHENKMMKISEEMSQKSAQMIKNYDNLLQNTNGLTGVVRALPDDKLVMVRKVTDFHEWVSELHGKPILTKVSAIPTGGFKFHDFGLSYEPDGNGGMLIKIDYPDP